ncbi:MAG TPA: hypothetical protein VFY20_06915 [Gemmatimonadales bacterium]|nr:hypothetical protein [Gemmatimonadales bacterium]
MTSRSNGRMLAIALVLAAACSKGAATPALPGTGDAPKVPAGAAKAPAAPGKVSLAVGSRIDATMNATISSRQAHAGDAFTASVVRDVKNAGGSVVIPTGSTVHGVIREVSPAPNTKSTGTLTLAVTSVTVRGQSYDLDASIDALKTISEGRGVEVVDVGRVAGGAAAGAVLGQVIAKNTTGTIVGGVVGGATGAAVSVIMKDMDIVLPAGAHLLLTLQDRLSVAAR